MFRCLMVVYLQVLLISTQCSLFDNESLTIFFCLQAYQNLTELLFLFLKQLQFYLDFAFIKKNY